MKVIKFAILILGMGTQLIGCSKVNQKNAEIIYQETSTVDPNSKMTNAPSGNILFDSTSELSTCRNSMGRAKITGQSHIVRVPKEEFNKVSAEQITEFITRIKSAKFNDWCAIVLDDGSAVFFFINDDFAIYGEWDEEKGIVKESGTYKPDKDGLYRYEETK